jgi:hypothetical protein
LKGVAEADRIRGERHPTETPAFRICLAVLAEGGGDDSVRRGELPCQRMPEPGLKSGGVEKNQRRTLPLIEEIGEFRIPDVLLADLRSMTARLVHDSPDPSGKFILRYTKLSG